MLYVNMKCCTRGPEHWHFCSLVHTQSEMLLLDDSVLSVAVVAIDGLNQSGAYCDSACLGNGWLVFGAIVNP